MLHHLTFGRNIGTQCYVTDLDWELYCQEVLDANFDGYTVQDAMGSWKSMPEDSKVVIIDTNDTQNEICLTLDAGEFEDLQHDCNFNYTDETDLGTALLNAELGEYVTKVTIYKPNCDIISFC